MFDNVHEMSNPVFCENNERFTNLSSAELAKRVIKAHLHEMVTPVLKK